MAIWNPATGKYEQDDDEQIWDPSKGEYYTPLKQSNQLGISTPNKEKESKKTDSFLNATKNLGDTLKNSSVKNNGFSLSNAITDLANTYDAGKNLLYSLPVAGNYFKAGDVAKKTLLNASTNLATGAMKSIEGTADLVSDLIVNPAERGINYAIDYLKSGKNVAYENSKDLKEQQKRDIKRNLTQEFQDKVGYSDIVDDLEKDSLIKRDNLAGQVTQAIGGMVPSLVMGQTFASGEPVMQSTEGLSGLNKAKVIASNVGKSFKSQMPSNLMLGSSSYGAGIEEALNNGATMEQARLYGIGSSAKEMATEWITGGIPGLNGKGGLDKPVETLINKSTGKLKNEYAKAFAKTIMNYGYKFVGEGLEEGLSEIIDPYLKNATYSNGEKVNWQEVFSSFIVGGITGGILEAPNTAIEFNNNMVEANNNIQQKKATLPVANTPVNQNISVQAEENIQGNPLLENNNPVSLPIDKNTIQKMNTINQNQERFVYESSENSKIDNFRRSTSQFMNNSNETKSFVQTVEKVINDKNYNVTFDNTIGDDVNGRIRINENGEVDIRINPNSDRAGEFILTHEITHAIETKEMKDLVLDYAKNNSGFNESLESLKQVYGTEDVNDEVLADISGQLFGNEEFINNLSTSKPSIFKRIYDKIVSFANKITGNSKESLFIKDLKNKWENAYRTQFNNLEVKENYSLIDKLKKEKNNQISKLSEELVQDIQKKTLNNMKNRPEVKLVSVDDILSLKKDGGYRTNEQISSLANNIMANGIESPIEISIDENGNRELYNGNHRLLVAEKLGLKEVPVIYRDNLLVDRENFPYNKDIDKFYRGEEDGNFTGIKKSKESVNQSESNIRNGSYDSKQSNIERRISGDGGLSNSLPGYNDGTSSNSAFEKNDISKESKEELKDSSFSFDENAKQYIALKETQKIEFYTKDNGDIKITLLDSNSDAVNDFTCISEKDLKKQLGDKIGEYISSKSNSNVTSINLESNKNNITNDTEYKMSHRPSEDYGNASDFERNMDNIFEHPEWYLDMTEPYNRESLNALRKVRNNPEGKLKIYRATPGDKINPGDWVTPSKKYAQEHLERSLNGDGNIIEITVKAKDVLFAGDDINEFGYFPENEKYSREDGTWQQFVESNFKSKGTKTDFNDTRLNSNNTEQNLINKEVEKITSKYEREKNKNKKIITKEASKILEFSDYQQKRKFTELVSEYYDNPDFNKIKQDIKNNFSEKRTEYVNDYVKDIKNVIRGTDLQITDYVRRNLTDFGDFRRENFNKLKLKNQGQSIDSFYNELADDYPSIFSKDITSEVDQLERLSEFMNEDDKFYEKYNLDENVINEAAQYVYESIKNKDNIDDLINSISLSPKQIRKEKTVEYREYAENFVNNSDNWVDKKLGLSYKTNTMKRNFYDVMGKKDGEKLYHNYIEPIFNHNAQMQNDISSYNEKISKLKLNDKESTAVQMFGEYKYNPKTLVTGMEVDEFITKNKLDHKKIENAVEVFRSTYDELIERVNETLKSQGYKEIDYRKGYFPHFVEEGAKTKFGKVFEKMGWKFKDDSVPTDIAGITDTFQPGKVWNRNAQQRKGKYTDFNALKGFDNYIRGAMETIYFTEDIQKLRALENEIRYQHSEKGVQNQIDEILSDNSLEFEERQDKIDKIYAKYVTPLNNLVSEIRDYTNSIVNKKSILDRTMEQATNRKVYSVMQNISSRLSANMVGLNLSSAITNFIPITQATSQVKSKYLLKGLRESIKNQAVADNFESKSVFLTSRLNEADRLYKTRLEKFSEKANFIFDGIDSITANTIVRGKYYENIANGMSEYNAIRNADEFARDLMAGRTKGEMPTIFNSKNPLIKLFTSFQLEVNNQYQYMLKDLPRDLGDETKKKLIGAFVKMFFGAWIYNQLTEKVVGRKAAFSPADTIKEIYDISSNENLKITDKSSKILETLTQDIPFVGSLVGGGRLPISSVANPFNVIKGESTLGDEAKKLLYYTVLPFGGGQLKKTIDGISMYTPDKKIKGSYTSKGKLRFEAKTEPGTVAKNILFGQYSSKEAREYFDKGYLPIDSKTLEKLEKKGVSISEYRQYSDDSKNLGLNDIKSDINSDGKAINGTASAKKAYKIMNSNYSEKEKKYLLSTLSSSDNSINYKEIESLKNDEKTYKFYFGLNEKGRKKFIQELDNYNISSDNLIDFYTTRKEYSNIYTSIMAKDKLMDYISSKNYDEKTKWYLYSKEYGSEDLLKIVNQFNVKTDDYFNVQKYLKEITYKYSGNSNTSKRKQLVFNYINNLKVSKIQKCILFKQAGYSDSATKNTIFNYINSLNISKQEKQKIYNLLY